MPSPSGFPPIRIMLVITELEVGGAERCLVQIARLLDRTRFEPVVVSLAPRPQPGSDQLVKELEASAIPVQFLDARGALSLLPTVRRLQAAFYQWKPEIVQAFLFHANVLSALAARLKRVPHLLLGARVADPSRWRLWLERWAARRADRIVCVSQSVASHCQRHIGLPPSKLTVIPNGIDVSAYPSATPADLSRFGLGDGERALLCVGRLHAQKGFDWLLENATELLQRWPRHHLLIVGQGPERARLEQRANALPVARRIHFLGWRADVADLLAASDLFVLPSRWEGMPNALLEAMASRLPVVATAAEGVEELLGGGSATEPAEANQIDSSHGHPRSGADWKQVIPFGDGQALIDAASSLLADPAIAQRVGDQNRRRVEATFSLERMVQDYDRLYRSLVMP